MILLIRIPSLLLCSGLCGFTNEILQKRARVGRRKEGEAVNGGTIGSVSNDDSDGSKDVIKAIRLLSHKRKQI